MNKFQEIKMCKEDFEMEILKYLQQATNNFHINTGVLVMGVDIDFSKLYCAYGSELVSSHVSDVKTKLSYEGMEIK